MQNPKTSEVAVLSDSAKIGRYAVNLIHFVFDTHGRTKLWIRHVHELLVLYWYVQVASGSPGWKCHKFGLTME